MDLASFLVNVLNKIEPIAEDSKSMLRVSLDDHFNKSTIMIQEVEKAENHNFQIDDEISQIPVNLPQDAYEEKVNLLQKRKLPIPKVSLLTKGVAFFAKPMPRLLLYVGFIILSGYLAKRALKKSEPSDENNDDENQSRKLSKKDKKRILKQYANENFR